MNTAEYTREAAELVAHNDRYAWLRGLRSVLRRAWATSTLLWSALALAAVVLSWATIPTRVS